MARGEERHVFVFETVDVFAQGAGRVFVVWFGGHPEASNLEIDEMGLLGWE